MHPTQKQAPHADKAPAAVTPTCQPDAFRTATLVAALEDAWASIRHRHPEVPAVVLVVGTGSPSKASQSLTLGHFAGMTWQHGDTSLPEVMVSGEGLRRSPAAVLATLLHEAAHGLAHARGIKDTSRQGRWHNQKFQALAAELGIDVEKDPRIGWSLTTLPVATADLYADAIDGLGEAMRAFRHPDPIAVGRTKNNNGVSAECACPRKIRVSLAVLAEGPITCAVCGTDFTDPDAPTPADVEDPDSEQEDY